MCQGWGVSVMASRTQWANLIWTLLSLNSGKCSVSVIYYAFPLLSLIYSCESHISPHTFFLQVFCFLSPTLSYCLPGVSSGKEPTCQCRRHKRHNRCEFDPWVLEKKPTPVFLPGESQGQGSWWATVHGVSKSQTRLKFMLIHVVPCAVILLPGRFSLFHLPTFQFFLSQQLSCISKKHSLILRLFPFLFSRSVTSWVSKNTKQCGGI